MVASLSTSTNMVYKLMSESTAMSNVDSNKASSIGPDIQQSIQENKMAMEKGSTDSFKQALSKIDILI
ncbi:MAG: hypothetical protein NTZ60_05065 [Campylobacterales bacterium]|nr:hypothetical protein [Campylobacterales bacterium]